MRAVISAELSCLDYKITPQVPSSSTFLIIAGGLAAGLVLVVGLVAILTSGPDRQLLAELERAQRFTREGRDADALSAFERALAHDSSNAAARSGRDAVRKKIEEEAEAEKKRFATDAGEAARREEAKRTALAEDRIRKLEADRATDEKTRREAEVKAKVEGERQRREEEERARTAAAVKPATVAPVVPSSGPLPRVTLTGLPGAGIFAVAFSPDGKALISGGLDRIAHLWDSATGAPLKDFAGHTAYLSGVAFEPQGKLLATSSGDGTVRIWDVAAGNQVRAISAHPEGVEDLAFSEDGKLLATAGRDRKVKLWDPATGKEIRPLIGHALTVTSVAFSPDAKILISGSMDTMIRVWKVATGRCSHTMVGHGARVKSIAFAPDGKTVVSGSLDGVVKVWNVVSGREIRTLAGHANDIEAVAFSPNAGVVASASRDGQVRLWETMSGKEFRTLTGHNARVVDVRFSPDGLTLATSGEEGRVMLWYVGDVVLPAAPGLPPLDLMAPIPDPLKQRAAEKSIREDLRAEYAKKAPADQKALARRLFLQGQEMLGDLTERYVLLRESRDVAFQAGDVPSAFAAIDELRQVYAVDAVALKIELLGKITIGERAPEEARAFAQMYLELIAGLIEEGDFERARLLAPRTEFAAKAAKDAALAARVQARLTELADLAAEAPKARAAEGALREKPGDPAANLAAGRFLCLARGEWAKGLPMLAQGADASLQAAAKLDLSAASVASAESWLALAEKGHGLARRRLAGRAAAWFWKAWPSLGEEARSKLEARVRAVQVPE